MLLLQPSPFATFFRTFIEMSILAIAAETFEITCKNTLVTDMLTKRVFVAIFLLLTFFRLLRFVPISHIGSFNKSSIKRM